MYYDIIIIIIIIIISFVITFSVKYEQPVSQVTSYLQAPAASLSAWAITAATSAKLSHNSVLSREEDLDRF